MERIELSNKKKSEAKKITGFHFSPGNPSEVLVSSADSRIRILDGSEVVHKFKGFKNLNSQISASFSLDAKHVICASEDSQVFVWKRDERRAGNGKGRSVVTTGSYESFQCKEVSIAIPWPGTVKGDLPPIQVQSKRQQSKRTSASQAPSATHSASSSPTKEDAAAGSRRHSQQSPSGSPTRDENPPATNNKKQLPPLPKKKDKNMERATTPPEEEPSHIASSEPEVGESFTSSSSLIRNVDSPSMSAAAAPSSSSDGTSHGSNTSTAQATAWGVVIVTATVGGEIRAYQNFGLPRRIGRL